jgi:hypothetical protein
MPTVQITWAFLEANDSQTFDDLVEAGGGWSESANDEIILSVAQISEIIRLGYYGKAVSKENVERLKEGLAWISPTPYGVSARLVDGRVEEWFKTLEEAMAYVVPRVEWVTGENSFRTDYGEWHLVGFTLKEIGVNKRLGE